MLFVVSFILSLVFSVLVLIEASFETERMIWRCKEGELDDLTREIGRLKDEIKTENRMIETLSEFKGKMEGFVKQGKAFGILNSTTNSQWTRVKSEFDKLKLECQGKLKREIEELIAEERLMENLWNDDIFILVCDHLLDQGAFTPQPQTPKLTGDLMDAWEEASKLHSIYFKAEEQRIEALKNSVTKLNREAAAIEGAFQNQKINANKEEELKVLKWKLASLQLPELIDKVETFQKNQREEVELYENANFIENVANLKEQIEDDSNSNSRIVLRLNTDADAEEITWRNLTLIPDQIIQISKAKEKELVLKEEIRKEEEKMCRIYEEVRERKGSDFIVNKYIEHLESVYGYMKRTYNTDVTDKTVPESFYTELITSFI